MGYATLSELKSYLGIDVTTDDFLLAQFLELAQGVIDGYCGRTFEAVTATKYFTSGDVDGRFLLLWGEDLLTVTTLTNGDGVAISSANYRLEPRNETRKYGIRLDNDTDWEFTDTDSEIAVAGTWGWSISAPGDIKHACIRLAAFMYRQKDTSSDIDRALVTGDGVTIMPSSIPADVKAILSTYRRRIG